MEFWLDVKNSKHYEVSNEGRVRNKRNGKILSPHLNKEGGYRRVNIDGKHQYVHRLVADAFYEGDHNGRDVNHIDGNKENNHIANLEWCDRKKNIQHALNTGLRYPVIRNVVRCKFCKDRYEHDHCSGMSDDFYCAYGRR